MISMVCEYNMGDDENVSLAMSHPAMSCYLDVSSTNVAQRKCLFYVSFCHFRHLSFVIFHSSFVIHISGSENLILSFVIRHLSFVIRHSYFWIRKSNFVICHLSFVICHWSFKILDGILFHYFVIRRLSFVVCHSFSKFFLNKKR